MCVLETLSHKLSVQACGFEARSRGGEALSPAELAGMLAGLPRPVVALAYAKLVGDEQAARMLYACLHVRAADRARAESWSVPRGSERLGKLARLVRDDLLLPRPLLSGRASARWIGVDEADWRRQWKVRHAWLLAVGTGWEADLRRKLGRELYGGGDQ